MTSENQIKWNTKDGREVVVTVEDGFSCSVTLGGEFLCRAEIQRVGNGPVCASIGKLGMVKENYDRVMAVALNKIDREKSDEQKAKDAEAADYDRHCEMMRKTMNI